MHISRIAWMLALAIYNSFIISGAQYDIANLAPGESMPMIFELGLQGVSLSVQAPSFDEWLLNPGQDLNEISGIIVVTTPGQGNTWSITIPAGIENGGALAEYDTTTGTYIIGGEKLDTTLQISAEGGNSVDLAIGGLLISGKGPAEIPIKLKQAVNYDNSPLIDGHIYRTSIAFDIS